MDVLDKYKETWKNQPEDTNKLSKVDIYKMSHKRSTSIVKWIFIIGIAEFLFFFLLGLFISDNQSDNDIESKLMDWLSIATSIITYTVSLYFLYIFYKNYKEISAVANAKQLMDNIVKTRKTVNNFIKFHLIFGFICIIIGLFINVFFKYCDATATGNNTDADVILISSIIFLFLLIPSYYFIKFYYHLLYGRLLDKLYYNHKELSKLDE